MNEDHLGRRLGDRLKAITSGIAAPPDLDQHVADRTNHLARRRATIRLASVSAALVLVLGTVAVVRTQRSVDHTVAPTGTDQPIETSLQTTVETATPTTPPSSTSSSQPDVDLPATNILVVGLDNGACVDPGSPTAGGIGDRTQLGERADTIMIVRVDPSNHRADVVSFPRDLWVPIAGTNGRGRLNAAIRENDPQRLINTIAETFGIPVDHYVQIDFCAFARIVDALGGVSVPFQLPTRDLHTGFEITAPGCFTLDGDTALAYVRSRHLEVLADDGTWQPDATGDFGRISRQQDFMMRAYARLAGAGIDLSVAHAFIDVVTEYVVTDPDMTVRRMLDLAEVSHAIAANDIHGHRIDGTPMVIGGASVIEPDLDSAAARELSALFRGEAVDPPAPASEGASGGGAVGIVPAPNVTCP